MSWLGTKQADETSGDPNLAALLTWLLPGAGHLYLGRPLMALVGFAVIEGLYWLGVRFTDGMLFQFLQDDLRTSSFVVGLSPEAGNLGALIWHFRSYGFGDGTPRVWPELMNVGVWMTAVSGMLNVGLMAMAHTEARAAKHLAPHARRPGWLVLAGWAIPGLGHWLQGRRARAAVVFSLLVSMLLVGSWLAHGSNLDRERHFYYWGGQFLTGLPAMVLEWASGHPRVTGELPYVDAGLVFAAVAGLLNVLALIDVYGFEEVRVVGRSANIAASTDPAR